MAQPHEISPAGPSWRELARLAGLGPAAERVAEAEEELQVAVESLRQVGAWPLPDEAEPALVFAAGQLAAPELSEPAPASGNGSPLVGGRQLSGPPPGGTRASVAPSQRHGPAGVPGVVEAISLIRRGLLSPAELVEACLRRIEAAEPALQAWVLVLREQARAAARRAEAALRAGGPVGPLHGIPFAVKDIFHVAGVPTAAGTVSWQVVPQEDARVVARLREAGAVLLGKTTTTEFAFRDPAPTRNPWNPDHTPGGSSSGSAAAVAARMVPIALGSQTAGSLVRPASYCGVVTLKPTYGRISRHGVLPLSWSLDHVGAFTLTVADQVPVLAALSGPDPEDPSTLGLPAWAPTVHRAGGTIPLPEADEQAAEQARGLVVGVPDRFFDRSLQPEARALWEAALGVMEGLGMRLEPVSLPACFEAAQAAHHLIMRAEAAAYHLRRVRERPDGVRPGLRRMVLAGALLPAVAYQRAQQLRRTYVREMRQLLRRVDVLAAPATPGPAPRGLEWTGPYALQVPFTLGGFPVLGVPMGRVPSGLPVGLQLAADLLQEGRVLLAGMAYQAVTDWHRLVPPA